MTIEEAVVAYLIASVPVIGGRVSPNQPEKGSAFPLATYMVVFDEAIKTHKTQDGSPIAPGSVRKTVNARIQLTFWDSDYGRLVATQLLARDYFDGFKGIMGGPGGVEVGSCFATTGIDGVHETLEKRVRMMDLKIKYVLVR